MLGPADITKVYEDGKRAIDGLTMRLQPGVLGLLGPTVPASRR